MWKSILCFFLGHQFTFLGISWDKHMYPRSHYHCERCNQDYIKWESVNRDW